MNTRISQIEQKKLKLDAYKPLPKALTANLDEWFKIELTYTSNAIEGNTLSRQETAQVVEKGITVEGKSVREHLEAINHAHAFEHIYTLVNKSYADITERDILDIHTIILHSIDQENAGKYRNVPVRIAGSTVIMPNPLKVPDMMREFIKWLHSNTDHIVKIATDVHFKLVSIHPFTDGNGRAARLLMNLILMQAGYPPAIIRKEDRGAYIDSIEKAQLSGNMSDYYDVMYVGIEQSLEIYLDAIEQKNAYTRLTEKKLLKIGEVAALTQETVPTIRYWTKEGLLIVTDFSAGGYQLYSPDTIERVKMIRKLQTEKRLTIEEIKKEMQVV